MSRDNRFVLQVESRGRARPVGLQRLEQAAGRRPAVEAAAR